VLVFVVFVVVVVVVVVELPGLAAFVAILLASLAIALAVLAIALAVLAIVLAVLAIALAVVFAGLLAAVLFATSPPQAIPKALKAKSDESAITFFILKVFLLSSSKINLVYFTGNCFLGSIVPSLYFWNIAQYKYVRAVSQPSKRQINRFFEDFLLFLTKSDDFARICVLLFNFLYRARYRGRLTIS